MDLYQAIISRQSVRRYRDEPLDKATLDQIDEITDHAKPLIPDNRVRMMRRDVVTGEDLIAAMGGYGRIVSPPHYLVAYTLGDDDALVDLAFRMEQIAVQMVQIGVSSCFISSAGHEANVRVRFRLPQEAQIGAFLIFGRSAASVTGRTINAVIRKATGGTERRDPEKIFYSGDFETPAAPPKQLRKLIEAGRQAPSAKNVQPWRFLWLEPELYLFLVRGPAKGEQAAEERKHRHFDGGTCMANIYMALETTEFSGEWQLLDERPSSVPDGPETLAPLAKLVLR